MSRPYQNLVSAMSYSPQQSNGCDCGCDSREIEAEIPQTEAFYRQRVGNDMLSHRYFSCDIYFPIRVREEHIKKDPTSSRSITHQIELVASPTQIIRLTPG